MVKQLPAPAKDFSSIARRLLLNHNSWENSQLLNTFGPISCTTPRQVKRKHHRCDLCDRLRSLTAEKLTAPIEKPYEVVKPNKGLVGRPSLGRKTKVIVKRVREFFEELKKQIGELGYGTILNSAAVMTGLACGVSCKTVTRITKGPECKKKSIVDRYTIRKANFKKYGPEWGEVVRHFVHNEFYQQGNVTVSDLHRKLCFAYTGFPMSEPTLYGFLETLGFSYRKDRNETYIEPNSSERENISV
ncbi:hypothetical protein NECAME_10181 [Necator americanus]|uniref:Uncharacterized protein n=1 Tax=Necator americanus TaxID=51031 RepID=W2TCJ7_NECAM|nr:hypothetical protein NECAME_10181 [Necator americanus]ETN78742.1 hypothetical protein NECAME_10181 [Necator americanus]